MRSSLKRNPDFTFNRQLILSLWAYLSRLNIAFYLYGFYPFSWKSDACDSLIRHD